mmetsp:Transcript_3291/g.7930  ORF Transcript_3291/g.7930 Transcript_3291/m.7930 type:complete len:338 (-) Transcript_3291:125-1138(-)
MLTSLYTLDIKGAYLYSPISQPIYIQPPEMLNLPAGKCLKLKRSIYGLKQAGRLWNQHFKQTLIAIGFHAAGQDEIIFSLDTSKLAQDDPLHQSSIAACIISCYVDDVLAAVDQPSTWDWFSFLGAERKHRQTIRCHSKKISGSPTGKLHSTRPVLSSFRTSSQSQLPDATRLGSPRPPQGTYFPDGVYRTNQLLAHCDSTWACDLHNRRSRSGSAILLNGSVIYYASKLQNVIALSSTEAEITAASELAKMILYLRQILEELKFPQPPTVLTQDNLSTCKLIANERAFHRTKHLDTKQCFIRQLKAVTQARMTQMLQLLVQDQLNQLNPETNDQRQ